MDTLDSDSDSDSDGILATESLHDTDSDDDVGIQIRSGRGPGGIDGMAAVDVKGGVRSDGGLQSARDALARSHAALTSALSEQHVGTRNAATLDACSPAVHGAQAPSSPAGLRTCASSATAAVRNETHEGGGVQHEGLQLSFLDDDVPVPTD